MIPAYGANFTVWGSHRTHCKCCNVCVKNYRICKIILQLYLSARCQITPLTKTRTETENVRWTISGIPDLAPVHFGNSQFGPSPFGEFPIWPQSISEIPNLVPSHFGNSAESVWKWSICAEICVVILGEIFSGHSEHWVIRVFEKNGTQFGQTLPLRPHLQSATPYMASPPCTIFHNPDLKWSIVQQCTTLLQTSKYGFYFRFPLPTQ